MSGDEIRSGEFERFAKSITENNRDVKICLEKITTHLTNNDRRHEKADIRATASEKEQKSMKKDIAEILKIVNERKAFFNIVSNISTLGKLVIVTIFIGVLTAAGTGIYGYLTKAPIEIKPVIKKEISL
jgi:hypothetical protein